MLAYQKDELIFKFLILNQIVQVRPLSAASVVCHHVCGVLWRWNSYKLQSSHLEKTFYLRCISKVWVRRNNTNLETGILHTMDCGLEVSEPFISLFGCWWIEYPFIILPNEFSKMSRVAVYLSERQADLFRSVWFLHEKHLQAVPHCQNDDLQCWEDVLPGFYCCHKRYRMAGNWEDLVEMSLWGSPLSKQDVSLKARIALTSITDLDTWYTFWSKKCGSRYYHTTTTNEKLLIMHPMPRCTTFDREDALTCAKELPNEPEVGARLCSLEIFVSLPATGTSGNLAWSSWRCSIPIDELAVFRVISHERCEGSLHVRKPGSMGWLQFSMRHNNWWSACVRQKWCCWDASGIVQSWIRQQGWPTVTLSVMPAET